MRSKGYASILSAAIGADLDNGGKHAIDTNFTS